MTWAAAAASRLRPLIGDVGVGSSVVKTDADATSVSEEGCCGWTVDVREVATCESEDSCKNPGANTGKDALISWECGERVACCGAADSELGNGSVLSDGVGALVAAGKIVGDGGVAGRGRACASDCSAAELRAGESEGR